MQTNTLDSDSSFGESTTDHPRDELQELREEFEAYKAENEREKAELRQETQELREENEELREEIDDLRDDQEETDDKADANRASLVGIINDVRGYEDDERLGLSASNGVLHKEAKNTGTTLYDTVKATDELEGLAKFRESLEDSASRSKVASQLAVLEHARQFGEARDEKIVRIGYRELANVYGCEETYAYTVMKKMDEEVPGCLHKDGRTLGVETQGVGGQHLEIQLATPALQGWIRARN